MLSKRLKSYNKKFLKNLDKNFLDNFKDDELKEILKYSFEGGKRLRPIIVDEVVKKMNKKTNNKMDGSYLALMVELIHTSSLLIDDLPSMDNDVERRGKPTFHKKYNTLGAKMASSVMLSGAYDMLEKMFYYIQDIGIYSKEECELRTHIIYTSVLENLGENGIIMGQYIDLLPLYSIEFGDIVSKELSNYKTGKIIRELIYKKTTVLFELAFVSSYILSGGDINNVHKVKEATRHFGLAFQISDDFLDEKQDTDRIVKGLTPNYVINFGKDISYQVLKESVYWFRKIMIELNLWSRLFNDISLFLIKRVESCLAD
tara:strand:+ start:1229 stop:2176 length:948 start_codon:yes stop_codon:yes gene_type:complete